MPMMLLLAVVSLGFAAFLVGEVATLPQRRRELSLKRATVYGARKRQEETELPRFKERVVMPAVERLASFALRLNPKASVDALGARLIAAGLASRISATQFLAIKSGAAGAGIVVALVGVAGGPP